MFLDKVISPDTFTWIPLSSHIDFVNEKRPLDVTGQGDWRFLRFSVKNFEIIYTKYTTVHKIQHFRKCIYILSIFVCSLSGPGLAPSVHFILLYTTLNLKALETTSAQLFYELRKSELVQKV